MPAPDAVVPDEWQAGLTALRNLPPGSVALLIGATDRGKTTFAALAARLLAEENERRVAVVDSDVGQSEIGPPGTVGLAWAQPDAARLHDLKPVALFFVGAFAPNQAALEHVAAVTQAVHQARAKKATLTLVDTTGFVFGPAARRLKVAKAQAIAPALILAFDKNGEIMPLAHALASASGAPVVVLQTPASVGKKPPGLRATRRLTRLSQALENGRELVLPLEQIVTVGSVLGTGVPLAPHLAQWAGVALKLPIVHGEHGADGVLTLFANAPVLRTGWESDASPVAAHFGARTVRAVSLAAYAGVLLGVHDAGGKLLAVGVFRGLDAEKSEVRVFARVTDAEKVRLLAFGRVRVGEDGVFVSDVRTGEI